MEEKGAKEGRGEGDWHKKGGLGLPLMKAVAPMHCWRATGVRFLSALETSLLRDGHS